MKKYLIIGGNGFIGSHLAEALLEQGNNVAIIDTAVFGVQPQNPKLASYVVDIDDEKKVDDVFEQEKPDVVFHLAGAMGLRKGIDDPLFARDADFLTRTRVILDACHQHQIKKILFVSSGGALYENAATVPTREEYPASPHSLYGLANLLIEKYIQAHAQTHTISFVLPRLANVYGPRQWQSGVIPSFIGSILKKQSPVIFGSGEQTRDFIYIDDAVAALIMLAEKADNGIYNVGSGKELSLKKLCALINTLLGADIKPTHAQTRPFEVGRSALDINKIKKEFGFKPVTDIEEGLAKTIEWYKVHGSR